MFLPQMPNIFVVNYTFTRVKTVINTERTSFFVVVRCHSAVYTDITCSVRLYLIIDLESHERN